jgi:hypothetical protein
MILVIRRLMEMMKDIRNINNLSIKKQKEIIDDCLKELKDDDINKTILNNKRKSLDDYYNHRKYKL